MHVLVRILAVDDIGVDYPPIDPDNFNKLMMARDVKSLVLAARDLGPMYISADILSRRTFIPSHLQQDIECGFNLIPPDLESLLSECYFDPYAIPDEIAGMGYRAISRTGKKATRELINDFDFTIAGDLSYLDSQFRAIVEPLHDWIFARNLLSIIIRIGGLYRFGADPDTILEAARFRQVNPMVLKKRFDIDTDTCYAIPIAFNPIYRMENLADKDISFDALQFCPLYGSLIDKKNSFSRTAIEQHLKGPGNEFVKFLAPLEASRVKNRSDNHESHSGENKWRYMVVSSKTNADGENKGDESSGSQLQAPTVSVTGMDVVGERVTAKVSNLPAGSTQVSYQWQYSSTKTGTFSDIKYGGNTNSYEISEEDEDYYLRCKVTTSSSKGKVPDAYSETIGKVYVFDWSKYPTGSYRPRFNGNSLACCTAPYDSSTQIPSLGEGDYASIVFDNELSDIPQGNITYRWFKCAGLGSGAQLVAKELGSSPSLSLSGLQGSCINCEVTLTVNGKSKTFVPKAICNGKLSDGIYVRPRIG